MRIKQNILLASVLVCLLASFVFADNWNEYKRQHFIIYYKDAPKSFIESVEQSAEDYYQEITRNLGFTRYKGWTWDERAKIYIYDDADAYINSGKVYGWSHGSASPETKVIRTFPAAHGFFDSTLPHEVGHIVFREFVGFNADVPLWLEEGIAMYQEKAQRWGSHETVRKAILEEKFIPLSDLTRSNLASSTQEEVQLFYAESASLVHYIISEQGQHRFVNLCRKLSDGKSFEVALKSVYVRFKDLEDLNKAWVDYLTR